MTQEELFKKLVAHCKEYGFVFPSSEIYDGLGAVYDYGQNGVELKNNIKRYWWDSMVKLHENIVGIDAAIFMHPKTWEASGHVSAFNATFLIVFLPLWISLRAFSAFAFTAFFSFLLISVVWPLSPVFVVANTTL